MLQVVKETVAVLVVVLALVNGKIEVIVSISFRATVSLSFFSKIHARFQLTTSTSTPQGPGAWSLTFRFNFTYLSTHTTPNTWPFFSQPPSTPSPPPPQHYQPSPPRLRGNSTAPSTIPANSPLALLRGHLVTRPQRLGASSPQFDPAPR